MSKEVDNTVDENNNESPEDRYVFGFDIEAALGNAERERPIARNVDQSDRIPNTNNDSTSGNDNTTTSISEDGTQSQQPNVSPEAAPDASVGDVTTDATQDRATEADAQAATNTTKKYPNGIWADQPHEAEPNGQRQTDARRSPQSDTPATSAAEKPQQGADEGRRPEPDTTAVADTNAKRGQDRPGEQPTETQMQTRSTDTPETTTEGEFTTTSSSVVDASVLRGDADTDLEKRMLERTLSRFRQPRHEATTSRLMTLSTVSTAARSTSRSHLSGVRSTRKQSPVNSMDSTNTAKGRNYHSTLRSISVSSTVQPHSSFLSTNQRIRHSLSSTLAPERPAM